MLVMDASLSVVFSLPSLMFSKILRSCGISQISVGRRAALRATTSHGKRMMRMLLSLRKLLLYLYAVCQNAADLDRWRDSGPEEVAESKQMDWLVWLERKPITAVREDINKSLFFFCESHYVWWSQLINSNTITLCDHLCPCHPSPCPPNFS